MQAFDTVDRLRLELQDDWPGPANLVLNPSGADLAAHWLVDYGATSVAAVDDIGDTSGPALILNTATPGSTFGANCMAYDTGGVADHGAAARLEVLDFGIPAGGIQFRVLWYDTVGYVLGASDWSAAITAPGVTAVLYSTNPGPSPWIDGDATRGQVRLQVGFVDPAATGSVFIRNVTLATGNLDDLAAAQAAGTLLAEPAWVNVLGSALNIKIERTPLNVSTLTTRIRDSDLDPARVHLVSKGRRARAIALDVDDTWSPIFTGRIFTGQASYDVTVHDPDLRVDISMTLVDPNTVLANTPCPEVYGIVTEVAGVVTGGLNRADIYAEIGFVNLTTGVPFATPVTGPPSYATPVWFTLGDNVTVLDQLIVIRDSTEAYVWVDRRGRLRAQRYGPISTYPIPDPVALLDEHFYNGRGPTIGLNLDDCVNEVTFKVIADAGGSAEVTFGPYVDQMSQDRNGRQAVEISVLDSGQGVGATTAAGVPADANVFYQQYAATIFATNGYPRRRASEVAAAVVEVTDFADDRAVFRDLYDIVEVVSEIAGVSELSAITSVDHDISPDKWLVTLGLVEAGTRPLPTVSASV